jgi:hypothetical protein
MSTTGAPLNLSLFVSGVRSWGAAMDANIQAINDAIGVLQNSGLTLPTGSGNQILATPANGSSAVVALRAMVAADVPSLPESKITNLVSDLALKASITYVDSSIAALVNSAPGALDTLKELADALGDDANFAATMTSALALKAPLASPAFTGHPTGVTEATGDSSTRLATTALVDAKISAAAPAVSSVFGRTGAVVSANNDYSYAQLSGLPQLAMTKAAVASNFLTSYTSTTGLFTAAQPAFTDISGTAATGQIPNLAASKITSGMLALAQGGTNADLSATGGASQVLKQISSGAAITVGQLAYSDITGLSTVAHTGAYSDLTGKPTLAATLANASHKWLNSYDSTTGNFTQTQPDYGDLTGTPQLAVTKAAVTSNFFTSYTSSTGAFTAAQPAFTDISGTASTGQIPNLAASKITSGTLALAQGGTGVDLSASGGSTYVLAQDGSHVISARALVAGDIPNLAASIITSGTLALARGGTNVDLSGSGSAISFLAQDGSHVISARTITLADLPASYPWSSLGAATGALTLANAGNATTFNQTSAVTWTWANTTASTSSADNSSPVLKLQNQQWTNGADTTVGWAIQNIVAASPNNKTITNSSENSSSVVTLTVGSSHGFTALQWVTFTGLTTATWLNGQTAMITATAATTITFLDPTTHGTSASHADNGTTTFVPTQELTFTPTSNNANSRLMFPLRATANVNDGGSGFAFTGMSANVGFGAVSLTLGGLALYHAAGGGSATNSLAAYRTAVTNAPTQATPVEVVWSLSWGDSSEANSSVVLQANYQAAVNLLGAKSTNTGGVPSCAVGNANAFTPVSGSAIGFGMGYSKGSTTAFNFAPTSGTATWNAGILKYTVNQTGGANGAATGLLVNAVETAVGGTHLLLDLQAGASGGVSRYKVDNSGQQTESSANAATWMWGQASELLTLA